MFFFLEGRELNTFTMVDQLLIFPINSFHPSWQEILSIQTPYGIGLIPKYPLTQGFSMGVATYPFAPRWQPICRFARSCPNGPNWDLIRAMLKPQRTVGSCTHHQPTESFHDHGKHIYKLERCAQVACERVVFLRCFFGQGAKQKNTLHPTWTLFSSKIACKCGRNDPSVGEGMDSISWNFCAALCQHGVPISYL